MLFCDFINLDRKCLRQVISGHGELKYFVGMDVDPVAHEMAQDRINSLLQKQLDGGVKVFMSLRNFRHIKSALRETGEERLADDGVDGILMDLGMSSMQVSCSKLYLISFFV